MIDDSRFTMKNLHIYFLLLSFATLLMPAFGQQATRQLIIQCQYETAVKNATVMVIPGGKSFKTDAHGKVTVEADINDSIRVVFPGYDS